MGDEKIEKKTFEYNEKEYSKENIISEKIIKITRKEENEHDIVRTVKDVVYKNGETTREIEKEYFKKENQ